MHQHVFEFFHHKLMPVPDHYNRLQTMYNLQHSNVVLNFFDHPFNATLSHLDLPSQCEVHSGISTQSTFGPNSLQISLLLLWNNTTYSCSSDVHFAKFSKCPSNTCRPLILLTDRAFTNTRIRLLLLYTHPIEN